MIYRLTSRHTTSDKAQPSLSIPLSNQTNLHPSTCLPHVINNHGSICLFNVFPLDGLVHGGSADVDLLLGLYRLLPALPQPNSHVPWSKTRSLDVLVIPPTKSLFGC